MSDLVPVLKRVVLEVFGGCNYACQMCPQSTGRGAAFTRKMPLQLFENILDQILELGRPVINLEGSGEATVAPDLDKYIRACTDRGLQSFLFTNGFNMSGGFMRRMIDAGLSFVRFSVIGCDALTYAKWMDTNKFPTIVANMIETQAYIKESGSSCIVSSYHLITDPAQAEAEIEQYRTNVIEPTGSVAYIWKMHNWSGNLDAAYERTGATKRSCGRPFADELTVRAGGNNGHRAAVTPCCQTMGPPNESASVLGHLDDQTILEVWNGEAYNNLRDAHRTGDFDRIDYCKNCDFLIDDPEVLVWTNDPSMTVHKLLGTDLVLVEK